MNLLGRRQFCLCLASLPIARQASAEKEATHTCALSFNALQSSVDKSSIKPLDFANQNYANGLVMILDDLTTYLGINLELFTYSDGDSPNAAFTLDRTYRPPNRTGAATATDGIILLGENLIKEMQAYFGTLGAPLTALCAHEAGHALQAKYDLAHWKSYTTNPEDDHHQDRYELCADFICGYAAWHRRTIDLSYPAGLQATTQFNKGDGEPIGHGTFKQRGDAVAAGYNFGRRAPSNSEAALRAAFEHVSRVRF